MSIFNLSGSKVKNNGGVVKAAGNPTRNDISNSSTSNAVVNGGSIVVDSNNTYPAYNDGVFAFNNNKPLYMPYTNTLGGVEDKKINGNNPIENRSRTVNSILTSTSIREGKYNYFNNTFDTNYPENSSYDLGPNTPSTRYQLGGKLPIIKNDSAPEPTPEPTPTIVGYVADSSFDAAEGTYCPAGTYANSPYYAGKNSDGSSNGWLMYFDADLYGWFLSQTDTPGVGSANAYAANGDPDAPPLTGWYGETATVLTLTTGNVCFE